MKRNNAGFTLVEIALALLVLSVGLLSLFGLFSTGLQMNKRAIDETQAALFAEEVLNGVRAQATLHPWNIIRDNIELGAPAYHVWYRPDDLVVLADSTWRTNRYVKLGPRGVPVSERYIDFGVRYRLDIIDVSGKPVYVVKLRVRPGEFGPTEPEYVFYTELYNHGQN